MNLFRRNPDRLDAVLAAVRKADPRLAELMAKYPDTVAPFLGRIEDKLRAKGLLGAAGITDRDAWRRLSALVPTALKSEAEAFKAALITEFEAEAARATG